MRCRQARMLIHETLDERTGAWPPGLESHLRECPSCQRLASRLVALSALARQASAEDPSDAHLRDIARRAAAGARWAPQALQPRPLRVSLAGALSWSLLLIACGALAGRLLVPPSTHGTVLAPVGASGPVAFAPTARPVTDPPVDFDLGMPGVPAASGVAAMAVAKPSPVATPVGTERPDSGLAFVVRSGARSAVRPRRAGSPAVRKPAPLPMPRPKLTVRITQPDGVTGSRTIIIQSDEGEILGPYSPGVVPVPDVMPREGPTPTPKPEGRPEYLTALYTLGGA